MNYAERLCDMLNLDLFDEKAWFFNVKFAQKVEVKSCTAPFVYEVVASYVFLPPFAARPSGRHGRRGRAGMSTPAREQQPPDRSHHSRFDYQYFLDRFSF